jgi:hypothetical protein
MAMITELSSLKMQTIVAFSILVLASGAVLQQIGCDAAQHHFKAHLLHFKILQLSKAKLLAIVTNGVASVAPWAKTAQETNISIDLRQIFNFAKITVLSSPKL